MNSCVKHFEHFSLFTFDILDSTQVFAKNVINSQQNNANIINYQSQDNKIDTNQINNCNEYNIQNQLAINLNSFINNDKFIAIRTKQQNAGIGQYGRTWNSPKGNLYLSCIIKLEKCNLINLTQIFTILIHDILATYNVEIQIKWINDILYQNKKMGGTICDICEFDNKQILVVGIGINVNTISVENSTYLKEILNKSLCIEELTIKICNKIKKYLHNFFQHGISYFLADLHKYSAYLNQEITLNTRNDQINGIFKGYDSNGMLTIECNNKIYVFHEGRLRLKDDLSYKL